MAERKRYDDAGAEYIGIARGLLAQLKVSMSFNKLMALSRTADLPGGVRIVVSSVFGQDTIAIHAPETMREQVVAAVEEDRQVQARRPAEKREVPVTVKPKFDDIIETFDACSVNISTDTSTTAPVTTALRIFIAGVAADPSRPAFWTSEIGYGQLGLRNNERNGVINAFSPDGKWQIGSVEIYDGNPDPSMTNPFNGQTTARGWIQRAYVWKSGFGNNGNPIGWVTGDPYSRATNMEGTAVVGDTAGGKFTWNGEFNGRRNVIGGAAPPTMISPTSKDGRVRISGNKYSLDGGPWTAWGPSGAVAYVVHTLPGSTSGGVTTSSTREYTVLFNR